ncbi:glycosyltransferase [Synechococcus sp. WH 8016]|uniref:glycosyltransferase family 2 protein n=1 Tax=Synechococcus sp. WH 8016 TaxID=166318 RepID=UPI00022D9E93|nr:glycosyltransferase [Synechococcus sp. WH 8016]EHA62387.1 glycosyl transferase family 2 [Synechococcus sp. WH 8016]
MDSLTTPSIIQNLTQLALANSYQIIGSDHIKIEMHEKNSEISYDVSILIATYNQSDYIQKAVESAVNQVSEAFRIQIIVADDGSSCEKQLAILSRLSLQYSDVIFMGANANMADKCISLGYPCYLANFLRLVRFSKGKYINFLDGDDYFLHQRKILNQLKILNACEELVVSGSISLMSNAKSTIPGKRQIKYLRKNNNIYTLDSIVSEGLQFTFHSQLFKGSLVQSALSQLNPCVKYLDMYLLLYSLSFGQGSFSNDYGTFYRLISTSFTGSLDSSHLKLLRLQTLCGFLLARGDFISKTNRIELMSSVCRESAKIPVSVSDLSIPPSLLQDWHSAAVQLLNSYRENIDNPFFLLKRLRYLLIFCPFKMLVSRLKTFKDKFLPKSRKVNF